MLHSKEKTSAKEVMTFQFSEGKNPVRTLFEDDQVQFVGLDVANTLGYKNSRKALKDHCKGVTKRYILTKGGHQKMNVIPEGDVFRLIINSELPSAQKFESWVMDEVLPAIRKKGCYRNLQPGRGGYVDLRDVPYGVLVVNGLPVRRIVHQEEAYYSVNDVNRAIRSKTTGSQTVKKLNAKGTLAKKLLLFGNTHPAWFTTSRGVNLIFSGCRVMDAKLLKLEL